MKVFGVAGILRELKIIFLGRKLKRSLYVLVQQDVLQPMMHYEYLGVQQSLRVKIAQQYLPTDGLRLFSPRWPDFTSAGVSNCTWNRLDLVQGDLFLTARRIARRM